MAKKLSREEWESMIKAAGTGRYELVRWHVSGKFCALKRCVVRCAEDGYEWSATVSNLVNNGRGCPQCAGQRKWTEEERIEQINKLEHVEFVSWVGNYKNCDSKAKVRCTIDGYKWFASVDSLINKGTGCPQCAGNIEFTAEERIAQINKLENIRFSSWVNGYSNAISKAKVRCVIDGCVWVSSVNNLVNNERGCPRCAKYGFQLEKDGYLYALRSKCGMYLKVGISNNPSRRHRQLERSTPFKFNLVEQISGDGVKIAELEKHFHSKYERAGFTGFDGATEWLICSGELLGELRRVSIEHE